MGVVDIKLGKRWAGIPCKAQASMALYAPTPQAEIGYGDDFNLGVHSFGDCENGSGDHMLG